MQVIVFYITQVEVRAEQLRYLNQRLRCRKLLGNERVLCQGQWEHIAITSKYALTTASGICTQVGYNFISEFETKLTNSMPVVFAVCILSAPRHLIDAVGS